MMRALRSMMEGSSTELPAPSSLPPAHLLEAHRDEESTELVSEKNTGDDIWELGLLIKLKHDGFEGLFIICTISRYNKYVEYVVVSYTRF